MALVLKDRVQETSTANTTVSFTLTGAVTGFQSFATIGNGNTAYYSSTDATGNWEVGIGTYSTSGPTLTRTTILASSNSGSAVTFTGTVNVFVTYPSGKSINLDANGVAQIPATNITGGISYNANSITTNTTIPSGSNASSAGPISVTATITVPTGQRWTVV